MRVCVITGPFRSGTSAVAQVAHRLGFIAAMTMTPPRPPRWHQDYEDAEAFATLLNIWPIGGDITANTRKRFSTWFRGYLMARHRHALELARSEPWIVGFCLKSPMYAPFVREMLAITDATVIVCQRAPREADRSNALINPMEGMKRTQQTIRESLATLTPDLAVVFDGLTSDPDAWTRRIARALRVDCTPDAAGAIDARSA